MFDLLENDLFGPSPINYTLPIRKTTTGLFLAWNPPGLFPDGSEGLSGSYELWAGQPLWHHIKRYWRVPFNHPEIRPVLRMCQDDVEKMLPEQMCRRMDASRGNHTPLALPLSITLGVP